MAQEEFRHETIAPGAKKDVVFLLFSDSHDVVGAHWHDEVELILITRGTLLAQLQGNKARSGGHADRQQRDCACDKREHGE